MLCKCGMSIGKERVELGESTCISCGDRLAQREIQSKRNRVALAYNKGAYMYMGDTQSAAANLRGGMNSQGRSVAALTDGNTTVAPTVLIKKARSKPKYPKAIGTMWIDGQPMAIFDKDDPRLAKAERKTFY